MIPKKIYIRELDIDIFDEEVNVTRAWVANKPCTGRREYADLSQVWHPAEEEPESNRLLLVEDIGGYRVTMKPKSNGYGWRAFIRATEAKRWAYVDDLLPKGGEK